MSQRLKAIYKRGAFLPQERCPLAEGSEMELIIHGPFVLPPEVGDAEERHRLLALVVDRMRQNPIPDSVPQLTREALHECR